MRFVDRHDAGVQLAKRLVHLRGADPVVVGLPRGGVPVAAEVARVLDAPLDVILVRKLGVPFQPELGFGAIGEDGVRVLAPEIVQVGQVTDDEIAAVEARERIELERRIVLYRGGRDPVPLAGRTVVVVDDGIATGSTARAALQVARAHGASRVVLAVPVAPTKTLEALSEDADEVVCLETPSPFGAVGLFYEDFSATSDEEVIAALRSAIGSPSPRVRRAAGGDDPPLVDAEVEISDGSLRLPGHLLVPEQPLGLVLFAHGSGSSRHSPRNRTVATALNDQRLATMLFDLLEPDEALDRARVFDIGLLAERLLGATRWVRTHPVAGALAIGYFGASTGAAAAIAAAARADAPIGAVVSRGGRPDLAEGLLPAVTAPTLLIVGGADEVVLELNRHAARALTCEHRLEIVPGATHLFEETGALEQVAKLAGAWFVEHLATPG